LQRGGALLLHMDTASSAQWIKTNMDRFLAAMGGTSVYKERLYNVVVEFVPVSFDPTKRGALHVVESDNNLPEGSLAKARWIKPPQQRRSSQRVAHAVLGFDDECSANRVI
ncbi:hypothetical protein C8R46DRAFT_872348, partial [Mycena filopes]